MALLKTIVRVTLALLTMMSISFVLDLIGIYVFIWLESDNQVRDCQKAKKENEVNIGKRLMEMKEQLKSRMSMEKHLEADFIDMINNATYDLSHLHDDEECDEWSFLSTLTLVAAIKTTIGWGNVAPITTPGRLFLMAYALICIPWFGFFIAFVGHLQLRALWWIHHQRMMAIHRMKLLWRLRVSKIIERPEYERAISAITKPMKPGDPPFWSIILALAYGVGFGTGAYVYYDELDFLESFYFSFINFTTIGFGDIIPQHKSVTDFVIISSAITYNMSILSICFSIVQSKFKEKLDQLKEMMAPPEEAEEEEEETEKEEEEADSIFDLAPEGVVTNEDERSERDFCERPKEFEFEAPLELSWPSPDAASPAVRFTASPAMETAVAPTVTVAVTPEASANVATTGFRDETRTGDRQSTESNAASNVINDAAPNGHIDAPNGDIKNRSIAKLHLDRSSALGDKIDVVEIFL